MIEVQHGCNSVEAEPVKTKILHPHSEIWQQKSQSFPIAIIEESAPPQFVRATIAGMEKARIWVKMQIVYDKLGIIGASLEPWSHDRQYKTHPKTSSPVPSNMLSPSSTLLEACEWTRSNKTVRPNPWAASTSAFSSSGDPNRLEAAKKEVTW